MSADVLRRAAALIRERAEAASANADGSGDTWFADFDSESDEHVVAVRYPHAIDGDPVIIEGDVTGPLEPETVEHIASWHPAVALAVADLLDIVEAGWVEYDPDGPGENEMHFVCAWAHNLARAYLGDES